MKRCRRAKPPRIRPVGRNERRRTRCGAPEAAQHADQDVDEGAHATLEAARGPEARQMAHEQSQIQTADVHQQAPEDVPMAAQMEPAQSAGFVEMRVGRFKSFAALAQQPLAAGTLNPSPIAIHRVARLRQESQLTCVPACCTPRHDPKVSSSRPEAHVRAQRSDWIRSV